MTMTFKSADHDQVCACSWLLARTSYLSQPVLTGSLAVANDRSGLIHHPPRSRYRLTIIRNSGHANRARRCDSPGPAPSQQLDMRWWSASPGNPSRQGRQDGVSRGPGLEGVPAHGGLTSLLISWISLFSPMLR